MIDERELAYLRRCIAYEYMKGYEPTELIDTYGQIVQQQSLESLVKDEGEHNGTISTNTIDTRYLQTLQHRNTRRI